MLMTPSRSLALNAFSHAARRSCISASLFLASAWRSEQLEAPVAARTKQNTQRPGLFIGNSPFCNDGSARKVRGFESIPEIPLTARHCGSVEHCCLQVQAP